MAQAKTDSKKPEKKKVISPPFRLSFPNLFEKSSFKGSEPKYSAVMIFHPDKFTAKDKAAFQAMKNIANEAALEFHKKALKDFPEGWKKPLKDGMIKDHLEGYGKGTIFATASTKQSPGIINRERDPMVVMTPDDMYPGCWCRATITAYGYDNIGKGVAFGLQNIQKLGEGQNFTGRVAAEEDFEDDADEVWKDEDVAPEGGEEGDSLLD